MKGLAMSLATPESVQKLQAAWHDKAKKSANFRFYVLYDKVYRKDVLAFAYACSKANNGAAGVDGQTFEDIEAYGVERWLDELAQELKSQTCRPLPVRRVWIPKPDGKTQRPLGVPAIRDRIPMMAAVLVLDPIFDGRPRSRTLRLSAQSQRTGRGEARPQADQHRTCRNRRHGPDRVF